MWVDWCNEWECILLCTIGGCPMDSYTPMWGSCIFAVPGSATCRLGCGRQLGTVRAAWCPMMWQVPGKARIVKWLQPCLQGRSFYCGWVQGVLPGPLAYIPWHIRQAHTSKITHQLFNPALRGLCVCVIAPPKGVAHVFTTNPTPVLCKWCQGQGVADICPLLALMCS